MMSTLANDQGRSMCTIRMVHMACRHVKLLACIDYGSRTEMELLLDHIEVETPLNPCA